MTTRTQCTPPGSSYKHYVTYAGRSMKGQFKGAWADYIRRVTVKDGITTTLSNPVSNWSSSTLDVVFKVAGDKDWSYEGVLFPDIEVAPTLQPVYTKAAKPGFIIIPRPVLTGSSVPRADYYQTVDVTLTGTDLLGANVATATATVDATHPAVGYAGEAATISNSVSIPASVVGSTTSTQAVVRLSLPQRLTRLTVDIKLTGSNAGVCTPFGAGPGAGPPPILSRRVTLAVPTAPTNPVVQRIDVLNAKVGRDIEFTITLDKSVPKPFGLMFVHFKLTPSNIFSAASGGISYDPTGFSRVAIEPGASVARFKVRVVSLPAGAVNVGTAYIQTWIGDKTKNQPPFFYQKEFTIAQ